MATEPARAVTIELYGEFDLSRRDELIAALDGAANADIAHLRFIGTPYMDSTALGCLIRLRKAMLERNPRARICIVAPSPQMRKLFDIAGMNEIFEITDDPSVSKNTA